jgi:hypothetical protein
MAELLATDSDGEQHFIWTQEHNDTCGPACVYMIERMLRLQCVAGGEERVTIIASLFPKGYHDGKGTESYTALQQVLVRLGIPSAARHVTNVGQFVSEGFFPFIARVGWKSGGGHFVVGAKTTNSGRLVCMDPWYGLVEPVISTLPLYPHSGSLSGHVIFPNASLQARPNLPSGAGWLSPPAG